ncbi:MAG: ROK family transcriptional regulator [Anaerolineae bacterium]|nr:ROK family transcriptional regulator [Anaerolineae bacterium]
MSRLASGTPSWDYGLGKDVTSAEAIRAMSRAQVLRAVREHTPISRSELAKHVPLSRATISSIVSELLDNGLLLEAGLATSTGGRRPALLSYQPEAKMALGVTMFNNEVVAVLTDLEGHPLKYCPRVWTGRTPEDLIHTMIGVVKEVCQSIDCRRVLGIGVGLPGVVDVSQGTLEISVSMGWLGGRVEVRRMMEEALHLPTIVANRSRIAALGELQVGVGRGISNLLYVFIGQGIAAGIVFDDGIYFGASSSAGEVGHITVVADGPLCQCGNHGCLEMYASESAIVARAIAKARAEPDSAMRRITKGNLQLLTTDLIIDCARQGDAAAIEVMNEAGTYLGIALSATLNILNPQMLVLGGPLGCKAGPLLLEPTVREIERRTLFIPLSAARIVSGSTETEGIAIGAAVLALKHTHINRIFSEERLANNGHD